MSGKFALFFLVSVCLVQGYQSRVVEPRGLIEDTIDDIKTIIKNIETALSALNNQLPDIIKNLEDKIDDVTILMGEIMEAIQDNIQESIDLILRLSEVDPEDVKDCIVAETEAVKQLAEEAAVGYAVCKQAIEEEVGELTNELEELKVRADKLIKDSTESIKQCIDEHGINVVEVVKCLKGHLEELRSDADALIGQIEVTIAVSNEKFLTVKKAFTRCSAAVNTEAKQKGKVISDDFEKCVQTHEEPKQPGQ